MTANSVDDNSRDVNDSDIDVPTYIKTIPGKYGSKDKLVLFKGNAMKYTDYAIIGVLFAKNEDNLHPVELGYRGGNMIADFVYRCMKNRRVSKQITKEYKLN